MHNIQCIIGKEQLLSELANNWITKSITLNSGYSVIPLTKRLLNDINELVNVPIKKRILFVHPRLNVFIQDME